MKDKQTTIRLTISELNDFLKLLAEIDNNSPNKRYAAATSFFSKTKLPFDADLKKQLLEVMEEKAAKLSDLGRTYAKIKRQKKTFIPKAGMRPRFTLASGKDIPCWCDICQSKIEPERPRWIVKDTSEQWLKCCVLCLPDQYADSKSQQAYQDWMSGKKS